MVYRRSVFAAILVLPAFFSGYAQLHFVALATKADSTPDYLGSKIILYDQRGSVIRQLYQDENLIFSFEAIKRSPDGTYVAALGTVNNIFQNEQGVNYIKTLLVVVDTNANIVFKDEDSQAFDWSPDGQKIAIVSGRKYADKDAPTTERLWILNIDTKQKSFIAPTDAIEIQWSKFDNNIYLKERSQVSVIETATMRKELTRYKDIHFSPSGRYYLLLRTLPGLSRLFESQTNKDVTPSFLREKSFDVNYFIWLDGQTIAIGDATFEKKILDVEEGKIIKTFDGRVFGFDKSKQELVLHKDKRYFKHLTDSRLEKVRIQ